MATLKLGFYIFNGSNMAECFFFFLILKLVKLNISSQAFVTFSTILKAKYYRGGML